MDNWEESGPYFPEPNLIEGEIYKCKNEEGEFLAEFCFGEGEFWWSHPYSGSEAQVTHFKR